MDRERQIFKFEKVLKGGYAGTLLRVNVETVAELPPGVLDDLDAFDPRQVEEIFRELEFRTLMARLNSLLQANNKSGSAPTQQLPLFSQEAPPRATAVHIQTEDRTAPDRRAILVNNAEALHELVQRLEDAQSISFDTETTSTDQMRAELVGIALAVEPGVGYYIPVGHAPELGTQLPLAQVLEALRKPLGDAKIPKVGHNLKYDYVEIGRAHV